MKKIILISLLIMTLFLFGCQQAMEQTIESQIESETGKDVEIDSSEGKMTFTDDDGTTKIEYTNMDGEKWCQEGAEWKMTSEAQESQAKMIILGIESSGEYKDYCHVTYDINAPDTEMKMDFYFNEEGEGYQVTEMNGQKFASEWNS